MSRPAPGPRAVRFVQFTHPGFEYPAKANALLRGETTAVKPWKHGNSRHNRKYLEAIGDAVDRANSERLAGVSLGFWGEWEPPSRARRLPSPVARDFPSFVHEPLRPSSAPAGSHQNTDPLVFGDGFLYSNCRQDKASLKDLAVGSVLLFGRGSYARDAFWLDTCLVVGEVTRIVLDEGELNGYGADLVSDVVLRPLVSEGGTGRTFNLYSGATPGPDLEEPFSFFPARLAEQAPVGFARPRIRAEGALAGLLTNNLQQGFTRTTVDSADVLRAVWREVCDQVTARGHLLGTRAVPPHLDPTVPAAVG